MTCKIRPWGPKLGSYQGTGGGYETTLPFPSCQMKKDSQDRNVVEASGRTGNLPQKKAEAACTWKPELSRHRKKQTSDKAISVSRLTDMILNLTAGKKKQTENSDLWANTGSCRELTSESSHLDMSRMSSAPASFAWREKIRTQRIRPCRNTWPLAAYWLNYSTGPSLENAITVLCRSHVIQRQR